MEKPAKKNVRFFMGDTMANHTEGPNRSVLLIVSHLQAVDSRSSENASENQLVIKLHGRKPARLELEEAFGEKPFVPKIFVEPVKTIMETESNGIIERYLLPTSCEGKNQWYFKGNPTFVSHGHWFEEFSTNAKKLFCSVCFQKTYQNSECLLNCRDCFYISHKQCLDQIKTECPTGSVYTMDLTLE